MSKRSVLCFSISVGSWNEKYDWHSLTIPILFVWNSFIKNLLTTKSSTFKSAFLSGQTSRPYSKIVFRHILFFVFLMQFGLWRAATFVSSPIHLQVYRQVLGVCKFFSLGGVQGAQGQEPDLHRIFAFQWDIWRSYGRISTKFYAPKITEKHVHGFAWNVAC